MKIIDFSPYQIFLFLLSIFFIFKNYKKFLNSKEHLGMFRFLLSISFWVLVMVLIIFPDVTHFISAKLGMGENLNTLIFTGFIILFIIIFRLFNYIENLEKDITLIVREKALEKYSKRNHETKQRNRIKN